VAKYTVCDADDCEAPARYEVRVIDGEHRGELLDVCSADHLAAYVAVWSEMEAFARRSTLPTLPPRSGSNRWNHG